jgi:hypothetical protein
VAAINVSDAYLCMPDAAGVSYIGMELMMLMLPLTTMTTMTSQDEPQYEP